MICSLAFLVAMRKLFLSVLGTIALLLAAWISLVDRKAMRVAEEELLVQQRESRHREMEWDAYREARVKDLGSKKAEQSESVESGE